jgi:hypothetical protein
MGSKRVRKSGYGEDLGFEATCWGAKLGCCSESSAGWQSRRARREGEVYRFGERPDMSVSLSLAGHSGETRGESIQLDAGASS